MYKHYEKVQVLKQNIVYYRRKRKLSQEQLAEMVGISRTHLSSIEAPGMNKLLSMEVLFDLSDALAVPVAHFFEE